jgi:hypothetical protein
MPRLTSVTGNRLYSRKGRISPENPPSSSFAPDLYLAHCYMRRGSTTGTELLVRKKDTVSAMADHSKPLIEDHDDEERKVKGPGDTQELERQIVATVSRAARWGTILKNSAHSRLRHDLAAAFACRPTRAWACRRP